MQVSEIMTQASLTESGSETLKDAAHRMWQQQTGSLLIMEGAELLGIITERDVLKAVARGVDVGATAVRDVMTKDVRTIESTTTLYEAARQMASNWIRHLPVVEAGVVVGVVSQRDLLGVFAVLGGNPDTQGLANADLVREQRLARIGHGDLD